MSRYICLDSECECGAFKHVVPMPICGRVRYIDHYIADLVAALNAAGIETVASCCGHHKQSGSILLEDGREIIVESIARKYEG